MCTTMPPAKKSPVTIDRSKDYARELEYLYARKTAIDSLIASLEEYERYRVTPPTPGQRKSA